MISEVTAKNPLCPIIVKMHVSTRRQEVWRSGQSSEDNDTDKQNTAENIVCRTQVKWAEEFTRSHDVGSIGKWRLP